MDEFEVRKISSEALKSFRAALRSETQAFTKGCLTDRAPITFPQPLRFCSVRASISSDAFKGNCG